METVRFVVRILSVSACVVLAAGRILIWFRIRAVPWLLEGLGWLGVGAFFALAGLDSWPMFSGLGGCVLILIARYLKFTRYEWRLSDDGIGPGALRDALLGRPPNIEMIPAERRPSWRKRAFLLAPLLLLIGSCVVVTCVPPEVRRFVSLGLGFVVIIAIVASSPRQARLDRGSGEGL